MRFTSIREVIEKTGANAKAAECLGKSGAFNNLEEDLNEIESAQFAKELVGFLRDYEKYKERQAKYEEAISKKEEVFREKVEARRVRQEAKDAKYRERFEAYERKFTDVRTENQIRASEGKKLLKEPAPPAEPKQLKEVTYPTLPKEPTIPQEPSRPLATLSTRNRIRLQREMLHVYLSGHPLDEVPDKDGVIEVKNLAEPAEDSWCTIRGVLQSIKVTNTRKKTLMARLRIEDKTGSIEVVAFSKLYESLKGALTEGELYEVLGRIDVTKRESDTGEEFAHIQFIGTKVQPIRVGSDKEWDIFYPLLKGSLRVLPGKAQKSKGLATTIIMGRARKVSEERLG